MPTSSLVFVSSLRQNWRPYAWLMHSMEIEHPQYELQEGDDEIFAKHLEFTKTSYCNMYTIGSNDFMKHVHGLLSH